MCYIFTRTCNSGYSVAYLASGTVVLHRGYTCTPLSQPTKQHHSSSLLRGVCIQLQQLSLRFSFYQLFGALSSIATIATTDSTVCWVLACLVRALACLMSAAQPPGIYSPYEVSVATTLFSVFPCALIIRKKNNKFTEKNRNGPYTETNTYLCLDHHGLYSHRRTP